MRKTLSIAAKIGFLHRQPSTRNMLEVHTTQGERRLSLAAQFVRQPRVVVTQVHRMTKRCHAQLPLLDAAGAGIQPAADKGIEVVVVLLGLNIG